MRDAMRAGTVTIAGDGGDEIEAYTAQPEDASSRGGVVLIHHLPGFDEGTKEFARKFAYHGFNAVVPNLYSREAPGAEPSDAAAHVRAKGGVPDERLVGDVREAAAYLRSLPSSNGRVGVIGHCSGGRQSLLAACSLDDLDAAVDCYGAFAMTDAPSSSPLTATSVESLLPGLSCPVLGLFGLDDQAPGPAEVEALDAALTKLGKEHEFHSYEGAGHAFFNVSRVAYRAEAAMDGWERIFAFYGKHLS